MKITSLALLCALSVLNPLSAQVVIIDSHDYGESGTGTFSTDSTLGRTKAGQYHTNVSSNGSYILATGKTATWTPTLSAGTWLVEVWNPTADTSMVTNTTRVNHAAGSSDYAFLQHSLGGDWASLGFHQFNAGTGGNVTIPSAAQYAYADAVRFTHVNELPTASFELASTFARSQTGTWAVGSKTDLITATPGATHNFTLNVTPGTYSLDYRYYNGELRATDTIVQVWDGATQLGGDIILNQNTGLDSFTSSLLGSYTFTGTSAVIRTIATGTGGNNASVYGVDLTVIPEPGTLALVGIALGSLLLFRRRR
jgi:hypothetical protein